MFEFYIIGAYLRRQINKIPEFCTTFARKLTEFYMIDNCPKIFSPNFGGTCSLPPVSYAYKKPLSSALGMRTSAQTLVYS